MHYSPEPSAGFAIGKSLAYTMLTELYIENLPTDEALESTDP